MRRILEQYWQFWQFSRKSSFFEKPFCFSRKKSQNIPEVFIIITVRLFEKHTTKKLPGIVVLKTIKYYPKKHPFNFAESPKIWTFWEFLSNSTVWDAFYMKFVKKASLENCWHFLKKIPAVFPKNQFLNVLRILKQ